MREVEGGWYELAISRDGSLWTSEDDRTIAWRDAKGVVQGRIDLGPSRDRATSLALSSDGTQLVAGTERGVVLVFQIAAC